MTELWSDGSLISMNMEENRYRAAHERQRLRTPVSIENKDNTRPIQTQGVGYSMLPVFAEHGNLHKSKLDEAAGLISRTDDRVRTLD